jgi:hypothetical protein
VDGRDSPYPGRSLMREVRRSIPHSWDLTDQVASYMCLLGDITEHDSHDRALPTRNALRREIERLRAWMLAETVDQPVAEEVP